MTVWQSPITGQQEQLLPDEDSPASEWALDAGKRALDELFSLTTQYRSGESYHELLKFVSRFRRYSPFNAMLVHIQKPGSRFIAPPSRWIKQYGRTIKPGAQPLVILQPMGPVMFVFDVSDTEGDALPAEVENPFEVRSGKVGSELPRTIDNACRDGIRITKVRHGSQRAGSIGPSTAPGYVQFLTQTKPKEVYLDVPLQYELLLNENHSNESQYATLVHELAHLYCGHLGTPNDKWWPDRRGLPLTVREFEAESVAHLVCRRLGIDPKSEEYLSGYVERKAEVPPISLECVMKVAGLIESMGHSRLAQRKKS